MQWQSATCTVFGVVCQWYMPASKGFAQGCNRLYAPTSDKNLPAQPVPTTLSDTSSALGNLLISAVLCLLWQDDDSDKESDDEEWARNVTAGKLSKGDKLAAVDHNTIDYPPFRKNFYIEVSEISRMTANEEKELRKELDGIKVWGSWQGLRWLRLSNTASIHCGRLCDMRTACVTDISLHAPETSGL